MSHVFVSYVHENQKQVERLSKALRSHGVDIWLDRDNIFPGMRWKDAIRQAIKNGAFFIACFSFEYENKNKSYMNEELLLAVDELRQYPIDKPWFIPVLFSECNVPALSIGAGQTLLDFQWVNLYSDWNIGFQKLLRALNTDEIERLKEFVDEYGYKYQGVLRFHQFESEIGDIERNKTYYLEYVRTLKEQYGISYDPLKLDRS